MAAIRRAGFGPDAEFSIPEPVAYLPESRLLLQENVAGRSATDLFLSDDVNDRLRMSERCAKWLARFHTVAPRSGPTVDLGSYQLDIEHWSRRIAGSGGACADKAGELRRRLEVAVSRIRDVGRCASHGSLSHHQVIAANGRTVTFDWDHHAVADPAFDVARFVVYLRRLALRCHGSVRGLDAPSDVFLEAYRSQCRSEVRGNLPFYAAAICLRLAKKDIRHQAAGWAEKAEATLDEGLRLLEQGV
jgi:aminoglycoside phosphotransferase (APT) family kinase protein